jgi:C-3',4' desaturase CrtD
VFAELGVELPARPVEPAMSVHIGAERIDRFGDSRWETERRRAFGAGAERFWKRQERLADLAWDFSSRMPGLPVDRPGAAALARAFRPAQLLLLPALGRTVDSILPPGNPTLRTFVDAQLLITAQTTAARADLIYGATALDLAREGTFHLEGGVSAIALALARTLRKLGSAIAYNAEVRAIAVERGRTRGVVLADGSFVGSPRIVVALPVQNLVRLCPSLRPAYRARIAALPQRWGAFMLYVGLPPGVVPEDAAAHHQVVLDPGLPLGEGNSAFVSISGFGEPLRARDGGRAVTLSTHTDVARWERAEREGRVADVREAYAGRLLAALERAIPGAAGRARLVEAATPHTFERYTGRARGLVGGVPQTPALASLGAFSHRTPVRGLYLCGDTAFPGQSTVGATLSGYAAGRSAASRSA